MNEDQAIGKWEQIKGRAKKAWGELTDDDLARIDAAAPFGVAVGDRYPDMSPLNA